MKKYYARQFGLKYYCLKAQLSFDKVLFHVAKDKINDYACKIYMQNIKECKGHSSGSFHLTYKWRKHNHKRYPQLKGLKT